jgi:hypothetical protein
MYGTHTYYSWSGMIARCTDRNNPAYHNYGGRGIEVCERWRDFRNFLSDMGEAPPGKTIDRKDNDEGYSKENCRWATRREQARNTRRNHMLEIGGGSLCLTDFAKSVGLSRGVLSDRINKLGWSLERAATTPTKAQ